MIETQRTYIVSTRSLHIRLRGNKISYKNTHTHTRVICIYAHVRTIEKTDNLCHVPSCMYRHIHVCARLTLNDDNCAAVAACVYIYTCVSYNFSETFFLFLLFETSRFKIIYLPSAVRVYSFYIGTSILAITRPKTREKLYIANYIEICDFRRFLRVAFYLSFFLSKRFVRFECIICSPMNAENAIATRPDNHHERCSLIASEVASRLYPRAGITEIKSNFSNVATFQRINFGTVAFPERLF